MTAASLGYRPGLTGIRGVAAMMVLLYHTFGFSNGLFLGGYLGVDVFFVLSGYLITSILATELQRRHSISLVRFYWHRALRLLPALFLCIAFTQVAIVTFAPAPQRAATINQIWPSVTYWQNWNIIWRGYPVNGMLANTWTLSVEEQFYILWPTLLFVGLRLMRRTTFAYLCLICGAIGLMFNAYFMTQGKNGEVFAYYSTVTHSWGLLLGSALALLRLEHIPLTVNRLTAMAATIIAALLVFVGVSQSAAIFLMSLISAIIILWITQQNEESWLSSRICVWLGEISYGMYLWQLPVVMLLQAVIKPGPVLFVVATTITLPTVYLSYRFVELPILQLKRWEFSIANYRIVLRGPLKP